MNREQQFKQELQDLLEKYEVHMEPAVDWDGRVQGTAFWNFDGSIDFVVGMVEYGPDDL